MAGGPALVIGTLSTLATLVAVAGTAGVPGATRPSEAELRDVTGVLAEQVAAVRRLPAPRALERRLVTHAAAREARTEATASHASSAEVVSRARLWERLGLLPAGADYGRLVVNSFGPPTASYDLVRRRLSVPDWIPLAEQQAALAHELAHAVADQRFDLRQFLQLGSDGRHGLDSDAERARLALVEGDAGVAALEVGDPRGAFDARPELLALAERLRVPPPAATPPWIRAGAAFAYVDGLLFVARVRARAPWSAVDALWAEPPASSEQILHPEKYAARDRPVAVTLDKPRALGDAWREASTDVLGELGVRTWLEAAVPSAIAARAAAGWGGDRALLFEPVAAPGAKDAGADAGVASEPPFVAWSTVWDDPTDAEDFARTAAVALAALSGDAAAAAPDDPHRVVARGRRAVFALAWRGSAVSLLVGAPERALGALDELMPVEVKAGGPGKRRPSPRPSPADGRGRKSPL